MRNGARTSDQADAAVAKRDEQHWRHVMIDRQVTRLRGATYGMTHNQDDLVEAIYTSWQPRDNPFPEEVYVGEPDSAPFGWTLAFVRALEWHMTDWLMNPSLRENQVKRIQDDIASLRQAALGLEREKAREDARRAKRNGVPPF